MTIKRSRLGSRGGPAKERDVTAELEALQKNAAKASHEAREARAEAEAVAAELERLRDERPDAWAAKDSARAEQLNVAIADTT